MIRAEVHSDNHTLAASFDATRWFDLATDKDLSDLAAVDWGGDYEADQVATFYYGVNSDVSGVFDHKGNQGFECNVCEADAARWIHKHRPHLFGKFWPDDAILLTDENNIPFYRYLWGR